MSNLNPATILRDAQKILGDMAETTRDLRFERKLALEWSPEEVKRAVRCAFQLGQLQATGALDEPKLIERIEYEVEQLVGQMAKLKK